MSSQTPSKRARLLQVACAVPCCWNDPRHLFRIPKTPKPLVPSLPGRLAHEASSNPWQNLHSSGRPSAAWRLVAPWLGMIVDDWMIYYWLYLLSCNATPSRSTTVQYKLWLTLHPVYTSRCTVVSTTSGWQNHQRLWHPICVAPHAMRLCVLPDNATLCVGHQRGLRLWEYKLMSSKRPVVDCLVL